MAYDLKAALFLLVLGVLMLCHMAFFPGSLGWLGSFIEIVMTVFSLFASIGLVVKVILEKLGGKPWSVRLNQWATRPRSIK